MAELKIATFNVEWMYCVFGAQWTNWDGQIPQSYAGGAQGGITFRPINDVPQLCERLAGVIWNTRADIVGLQEGPPRKDQLEKFVADYLDDAYQVHVSNSRNQTIAYLVHESVQDRVTGFAHTSDETALLRRRPYLYHWGKYKAEDRMRHSFFRVPLVLRFQADGNTLWLVNLHTKSKYSKLKNRQQWDEREKAAILDALLVRAKISVEMQILRRYLEAKIENGEDSIIVLGDLNDGPYHDLMEEEFLIHNIVDELVGTLLRPDTYFRHAMTPETIREAFSTSFRDALQEGREVKELIDHILVSPTVADGSSGFRVKNNSCKVEHEVFDYWDDDDGTGARHLYPSDHRPVSAVITY